MICKILGLFVTTWAADDRYSLLNRDNLTQPNYMQVSQKQKTVSNIILQFLKCKLNFEQFQKKYDPHS